MNNYTITQDDLDNNPLLVTLGYEVGDSIKDKSQAASTQDDGPDPIPQDPTKD